MRAIIQRVSEASVSIDGRVHATICRGLLVLLGIGTEDTFEDVTYLAAKISNMRIFGDDANLMNLSVKDIDGGILVVSQFTLHAQTRKGNRPSFIQAARPEHAIPLYETFLTEMEGLIQKSVKSGKFGADMKVSLTNDGPVTIFIDSREKP